MEKSVKKTIKKILRNEEDDNTDIEKELKEKEGTSISPSKLKRVYSTHLDNNNNKSHMSNDNNIKKNRTETQMTDGERAYAERMQCYLVYLNLEAPLAELNAVVTRCNAALMAKGVYPVRNIDDHSCDYSVCVSQYQRVVRSTDPAEALLLKRSFIWMSLFLARQTFAIFCPSTANEPVRCDANKLSKYLYGETSPFAKHCSLFLLSITDINTFVTCCTASWMEYEPWTDVHMYKDTNPAAASAEVKRLTEQRSGSVSHTKPPLLLLQ